MGTSRLSALLHADTEQALTWLRTRRRGACTLLCGTLGIMWCGSPYKALGCQSGAAARLVSSHGGLIGRDAGPVCRQAVPAPDVAQPKFRAQAGHDGAHVVWPALRAAPLHCLVLFKACAYGDWVRYHRPCAHQLIFLIEPTCSSSPFIMSNAHFCPGCASVVLFCNCVPGAVSTA